MPCLCYGEPIIDKITYNGIGNSKVILLNSNLKRNSPLNISNVDMLVDNFKFAKNNNIKVNIESFKTKETRDRYNNNRFLFLFNNTQSNEEKEINNESNLLAQNINISSKDTKIKGSNLISNENIQIDSNKVDILEQELYNTSTNKQRKLDFEAKFNIGLSGIDAGIGFNYLNNKQKIVSKENARSNLVSKNISINANKDISSSANIYAKDLKLNADNIELKDTKKEEKVESNNYGFNVGINAKIGSPILDVAENISSLNKGNITNKARNVRNIASGIHDINRVISSGDKLKLVTASVGLNIGGNKSNNTEYILKSEKGNIESNDISITAKDTVELTNQKIIADKLEIKADKVNLKQGENKSQTNSNNVSVGLNLSYDLITSTPSLGINGNYGNTNKEDKIYEKNDLQVKDLKILSNNVEIEKLEEKYENHSFDLGGNIGFTLDKNNKYTPKYTNAGANISKDGYGIGAQVSREGKIQNVTAKVNGESYDLNADLVYKENRDKLIDDVKNVINTPKAYVKAIDTTINIKGTKIGTEIKRAMLDNNVETETSLRKYKDLLENAKGDNEKIYIVNSYYSEIGRLGGKQFKNIAFIDNIINEKGEIAKAATSEDDKLYINVNNVDILDLDSMKDLVTYETKRWDYIDEEIDNKSLHYKQKEIKEGKTNIGVQTRTLTMEEMSKLRNYTYVPTFSDKEIDNEQKRIENSLTYYERIKYNKLDKKEKKIVVENMLLKKFMSNKKKEKFDEKESLNTFISRPGDVYVPIDRKGYTTKELERIAKYSYKYEDENKKIEPNETFLNDLTAEKVIEDSISGLKGYIFRNPNGEYIISFIGTENLKDYVEDIGLIDGVNRQYEQAYKQLKKELEKEKYKGKVMLIVGHSLGGGIARYVTKRIPNTQAMVFDPSPTVSIESEYNIEQKKLYVFQSLFNSSNLYNIEINSRDYFHKEVKKGFDNSGYKDVVAVIPEDSPLNEISKNEKGENILKFRVGGAKNEEILTYKNDTNEYIYKKNELEKMKVIQEYKRLEEIVLKNPGSEEYIKEFKQYKNLLKNEDVKKYFENEKWTEKLSGKHNIGPLKKGTDCFSDVTNCGEKR